MKLNRFKEFLIQERKEVFFTFGRMNPPTIGHGKLFDKLAECAGKNPYKIFLSQTQDSKKNPLLFESKIKTTRKFFPRHGRHIVYNENVRDILHAAIHLYEDGFKSATLVVGQDRVNEFKSLLERYNGKKTSHGFYEFQNINVISAGLRDPDSEGIEGISSSKLREAAANSDFVTFSQGLPKSVTNPEAKKLFNEVRLGLGLAEEKSFRNHVKISSVSDMREKYVQGKLFGVGDTVLIKESKTVGSIAVLGSNYVIVETRDGKRQRKWLNDVEKIKG